MVDVDKDEDEGEHAGLYRHNRTYNSTDISMTSVCQPNGSISKTNLGEGVEGNENFASICIAMGVLFHIVLQFTLYINSLWPFLLELDPNVTESFYGLIFAVYHFSGAAASVLFGKLSVRAGAKGPIILGLMLTAIGSIIHPFAHLFPTEQRKWAILAARGLAGMGAGARANIYSYTMEASPVHKRSKIVAVRTIVASVALMFGPLVQAAAVPVGHNALNSDIVSVSMYTVPDFISFATSIIGVVVMLLVFRDLRPKQPTSDIRKPTMEQNIDKPAIWINALVRNVQVIVNNIINSISSPIAMVMFGWNDEKTILFNGLIYAFQGLLVIPANMFLGVVCLKYIKERALLIVSPMLFIFGILTSFPWPWYPSLMSTVYGFVGANQVFAENNTNFSNTSNTRGFGTGYNYNQHSTASINYSAQVHSYIYSNGTVMTLRDNRMCNYSWCDQMPTMPVAGFITLIILLFLSNGVGKVPSASLFSDMLGPIPQGSWQGMYVSLEMIGMGIGPLVGGVIFEYLGPQALFTFCVVVLCLSILPFLYMYKRMLSWYEIFHNEEVSPKQKRFG